MEKEKLDEINQKLNDLVRVTFTAEALISETQRILLPDSEEQKTLKARILELLMQGLELKEGYELEITNYGFVTIYKVEPFGEGAVMKRAEKQFNPPFNWKLLPYGFVMGSKLTKTQMNNVLSQMR